MMIHDYVDGPSDMHRLLDSVRSDLAAALTTRSCYAVGRLHQTLLQVLEMHTMASMMNIPRSFIDAIRQVSTRLYMHSTIYHYTCTRPSTIIHALDHLPLYMHSTIYHYTCTRPSTIIHTLDHHLPLYMHSTIYHYTCTRLKLRRHDDWMMIMMMTG